MIDLYRLFAPFPLDVISWRAQSLTKDGKKAMALAYIDARDVMRRLDDVCGVSGWQCKYSHANGKTICDIGIKCGEEWIWKADGAGDTDIEAEKGAISDAFKRAAVKWGVGRYLYDMPAPWVPCESYESGGKLRWSRWTDDVWKYIPQDMKSTHQESGADMRNRYSVIKGAIEVAETALDLAGILSLHAPAIEEFSKTEDFKDDLDRAIRARWLTIRDEMEETILKSESETALKAVWQGWTRDLNAMKKYSQDSYDYLFEAKDKTKSKLKTKED